jgi:hypothetical protein
MEKFEEKTDLKNRKTYRKQQFSMSEIKKLLENNSRVRNQTSTF